MSRTIAPAAAILLLLLTGCAPSSVNYGEGDPDGTSTESEAPEETPEAPAEPLDLTGEWKQSNSASDTAYQAATITEDEIVINWVNEEEDSVALYWAGSYDAPTEDVDTFTWDSINDTSQTDTAMLASGDATKTFTFEGGALKYEASALGVTKTVELAKQ